MTLLSKVGVLPMPHLQLLLDTSNAFCRLLS